MTRFQKYTCLLLITLTASTALTLSATACDGDWEDYLEFASFDDAVLATGFDEAGDPIEMEGNLVADGGQLFVVIDFVDGELSYDNYYVQFRQASGGHEFTRTVPSQEAPSYTSYISVRLDEDMLGEWQVTVWAPDDFDETSFTIKVDPPMPLEVASLE